MDFIIKIKKAHGVVAIITDSGSVDPGSNPGGPAFIPILILSY
tara:strand:+ start:685 stop:813 length:129 start_codon:yes stop_codon:yes gene_type:complete